MNLLKQITYIQIEKNLMLFSIWGDWPDLRWLQDSKVCSEIGKYIEIKINRNIIF